MTCALRDRQRYGHHAGGPNNALSLVTGPEQTLQVRALEAEIAECRADRLERRRGQVFGFVIGLAGIGCAALVAVLLQGWPGAIGASALGGSTILGLVLRVLFTGRRPETVEIAVGGGNN